MVLTGTSTKYTKSVMINAWSLLYEELNGTMDETYPIKKEGKMTNKKEITVLGGDTRVTPLESDEYDPINTEDTISFSSTAAGAADTVTIDQSWWEQDGFSMTGNPAGSSQDTLNLGGTHLPGGMGEDHISFSGIAGTQWDNNKYYADGYDPYPTAGMSVDTLNINLGSTSKPKPNLKNGSTHKYEEDKGIEDLKNYVTSTYTGHYTNKNSDTQTLDLIHSVGDAESFCRSNALKYLSRYDKKGSAKNDILKAMHYCLLLYYFSGNTQEPDYTNTRYETF